MPVKRVVMMSVVLGLVAGCNLLTPLIFVGEHKKLVSPEFDKLPAKRVAVLVWADAATLFDYPFVRFELATYLSEKLAAEMEQRGQSIDVVDPRDVEDHLQRHLASQVDPRSLGQAFQADYVIYLEILEFQVRDPQQPQFLQGKVRASVAVEDLQADPDQTMRYELTPVMCVYPKSAPAIYSARNSPLIREAIYRMFAETVARKFYEHTVDL